jgi:predicted FMN-binding regulatory protein PaiB
VYVPPIYSCHDDEWPHEVVRRFPLATLVTNGPMLPHATHLPAVPSSGAPRTGPLAGLVMVGHMNRANPHWAALEHGARGRLIFAGPPGYITPTMYQATPAAPTANFVAIHLLGVLEPIAGLDATLEVLTHTVEVFEATVGDGWDPAGSLDYFRVIGPGVGAFRFHVASVESMFKLSQEKSAETRTRIVKRLSSSRTGGDRDLADLMRAYGPA